MAQIHIKENTTVETAHGGACNCTQVAKGAKGLERLADDDCAGEFTNATAYINSPDNQNLLIIPSATSLADATSKAQRCGGGYPVNFYSNPVLACAPYIRCNL